MTMTTSRPPAAPADANGGGSGSADSEQGGGKKSKGRKGRSSNKNKKGSRGSNKSNATTAGAPYVSGPNQFAVRAREEATFHDALTEEYLALQDDMRVLFCVGGEEEKKKYIERASKAIRATERARLYFEESITMNEEELANGPKDKGPKGRVYITKIAENIAASTRLSAVWAGRRKASAYALLRPSDFHAEALSDDGPRAGAPDSGERAPSVAADAGDNHNHNYNPDTSNTEDVCVSTRAFTLLAKRVVDIAAAEAAAHAGRELMRTLNGLIQEAVAAFDKADSEEDFREATATVRSLLDQHAEARDAVSDADKRRDELQSACDHNDITSGHLDDALVQLREAAWHSIAPGSSPPASLARSLPFPGENHDAGASGARASTENDPTSPEDIAPALAETTKGATPAATTGVQEPAAAATVLAATGRTPADIAGSLEEQGESAGTEVLPPKELTLTGGEDSRAERESADADCSPAEEQALADAGGLLVDQEPASDENLSPSGRIPADVRGGQVEHELASVAVHPSVDEQTPDDTVVLSTGQEPPTVGDSPVEQPDPATAGSPQLAGQVAAPGVRALGVEPAARRPSGAEVTAAAPPSADAGAPADPAAGVGGIGLPVSGASADERPGTHADDDTELSESPAPVTTMGSGGHARTLTPTVPANKPAMLRRDAAKTPAYARSTAASAGRSKVTSAPDNALPRPAGRSGGSTASRRPGRG